MTGISIADEFANAGCEVVLICGESNIKHKNLNIKRIDVVSAMEMFEEVKKYAAWYDIAILSAAVADYRPKDIAEQKIKKSGNEITLTLVKNPDILAYLGENKKAGQTLTGFALETENAVENAKIKLQKKNLDFIVVNTLEDEGAGFGVKTNKVKILSKNGKIIDIPLKSKQEIAKDIVKWHD